MKKYAKRIMAWFCVMLMTVGMAVPTIAASGNSGNNNKVYISPMVRNLDFSSGSGNVVGDDGRFTLKMEIYNPSPSINADRSYSMLRSSYVTLDNGTECQFIDMAGLNKDSNGIYQSRNVSIGIQVPDTVQEGKYKIESIHLNYGFINNDKSEQIKSEKHINISELANQKELEIEVAKSAEGNYPDLVNFAYGNVTNPAIVNGDSTVTASFVITQRNKFPGEYTKTVKDIQFTFKNDAGSFTTSCQMNKLNQRFSNGVYEWYPAIAAPDGQNIAVGKYKLDKIKFTYADGYVDEYTYDRLKSLAAYNDIELNVLDSSAQNLGDIRVSTNTQLSNDRLSVTIDDDTPDYSMKFYHKTADNSKIKKISVYLKNMQTGMMYGGTSSVASVDGRDDIIASGVRFNQSYPSGTYEIYSVRYETKDGLLITYYNENYSIKDKNNTNAKFTCKADNVIDFTNKVNPDAVTRTNIKLLYKGVTSTKSLTVKTNGNASDREVKFRVSIGSSGAKLKVAKVVFKSGNNQIVSDLVNEGVVNSNGTYYNASLIIPSNQAAGTYRLYSLELVSDRGVTTTYTNKDSLKIIVKDNDRIVVDEIGTTPKNTKVEKTDGVAKATVELPKETVSAEVLANTDEAGKTFAAESYEFAVESDVIPDNTTIEIGKVITGGIYDNVKEIAENNDVLKNADTYRVFEINLVDSNNAKVDNNIIKDGKVAITTTVPEGFDASKTVVYRVDDDGSTLIPLTTTPAGDGKVTFETNHFSTYVFALKSADNKPTPKPTPNPSGDPENTPDPDTQPGGGNKLVASENGTNLTGNNNGTPDTADNAKAPSTGDKAPITMLLFVMLIACVTIMVSIISKRRKA